MADLKYSFRGKPVILFAKPCDEQVCPICREIVDCPQQIICCGQDICKECLQNWLERQNTCPMCREDCPKYFLDKRNDRAIMNLMGKCVFEEQGCNWKGELRDIGKHLEECTRGIVSCPLKCGQKIPKGDLDEHKGSQCTKRRYRCQYCGHEDAYDVITRDHFPQCPRHPILCPNMCSAPSFPRCDLERHRTICPYQLTNCKFVDLGCSDMVIRSQMAEHCREKMADHLNLACSLTVELAGKLEKLQSEPLARQAEKSQLLTVPLTFAVCWSKLIRSGLWLSPTFSVPSIVHKFQLRVYASELKRQHNHCLYSLNLRLVFAESTEPFRGRCALSLIGFSSENVTLNTSEMILSEFQFDCGQVLLQLSAELKSSDGYDSMYDDLQDGRRKDMLDSLFGDDNSASHDLHSYVSDDHLAVKVDVQPLVVAGWYQNSADPM